MAQGDWVHPHAFWRSFGPCHSILRLPCVLQGHFPGCPPDSALPPTPLTTREAPPAGGRSSPVSGAVKLPGVPEPSFPSVPPGPFSRLHTPASEGAVSGLRGLHPGLPFSVPAVLMTKRTEANYLIFLSLRFSSVKWTSYLFKKLPRVFLRRAEGTECSKNQNVLHKSTLSKMLPNLCWFDLQFLTVQWCESDRISAETILWISIFSLASAMWSTQPLCFSLSVWFSINYKTLL